jgi:hypothetical protein
MNLVNGDDHCNIYLSSSLVSFLFMDDVQYYSIYNTCTKTIWNQNRLNEKKLQKKRKRKKPGEGLFSPSWLYQQGLEVVARGLGLAPL